MGGQLVLCVPKPASEQHCGAGAPDGEWEGLGDAPPLYPLAVGSEHRPRGRGWWRDAVVRSVCQGGSVLSASIPMLYKPLMMLLAHVPSCGNEP